MSITNYYELYHNSAYIARMFSQSTIPPIFHRWQNIFMLTVKLSFDVNALASTADQLTAVGRASLCIAAPMVQMPKEGVTVMAPGRIRHSFVEVPGSTNLDAVVNLAIRMELWDLSLIHI